MFDVCPQSAEGILFKFNGIPRYNCTLSSSPEKGREDLPVGAF